MFPGFAPGTSVDDLASAVAVFPEIERVALIMEKPLVLVNQETKAVAILRLDSDGLWSVEVVETRQI